MVKVEASLYQYKMIATLESTYHFRVPVFFQRNVKTKIMNKFKLNTSCFVLKILLIDDRKENVRWNNIYATELEVNLHRESAYWSKCLSTNLGSKLKPVINRCCIFNSVRHLWQQGKLRKVKYWRILVVLRGNLFDPPIMICIKVMIPSGLAVDLLYVFPFKIYWKRRIFPPFLLKQCDPPPAKVLEPTPPPPLRDK